MNFCDLVYSKTKSGAWRTALLLLVSLLILGIMAGNALAAPGDTTRVNVDSNGVQANNGGAYDVISTSADGRYVAFSSYATNLVPNDTNNHYDIFIHERQTNAIQPAEQITALKDDVTNLNLPYGINTSVQAKLNDAFAATNAGNTVAACTALSDFINQVNAQAGKKITQSDAQDLTNEANRIRAVLGC